MTTTPIAAWIQELAQFPMHEVVAVDEAKLVERRKRDAMRAFTNALSPKYRCASFDSAFLAGVKLSPIPKGPPTATMVVFRGPSGAGKTRLAVALLRVALERELESRPLLSDDESESIARYFHFAHAHRLGVARLGGNAGAAEVHDAMRARILLLDDLGNDCAVPSNPV
ncbi:MAG: hypothetical protein ACREJX_13380, partial [Polyangiaceae bacterium]